MWGLTFEELDIMEFKIDEKGEATRIDFFDGIWKLGKKH